MRISLNRKGISTDSFIGLFVLLVIAGALFPTIQAQFANSTYTGLSGAGAVVAGLVSLFVVIAIIMKAWKGK